MGCNQSKIENEEAVSRCKDRKQFMKDAVTARNAFAAAHSSYATYLKNTGAALSDYAHGEVPPQHHNYVPSSSVSASSSSQPALGSSSVAAVGAGATSFTTLPPPPPLPDFNPNPSPIHRSSSMPEIKIQKHDPPSRSVANPILEEEEEEEEESDVENSHDHLRRRGSKGSKSRVAESESTVPMSSGDRQMPAMPTQIPIPMPQQQETPYDYFFTYEHMPGPTLSEEVPVPVPVPVPVVKDDEEEKKKEERMRSKELERKVFEERQMQKRAEDDGGEGKRIEKVEAVAIGQATAGKSVKGKRMAGAGGVEGKRVVRASVVNLLQLFADLDDHFLKASESAHDVSKMLEATRLHYHSNFADNRGNGVEFVNDF